jgi:hypothetical protein
MAVVPHTGAPARRRKASTRARASSACQHARAHAAQAGRTQTRARDCAGRSATRAAVQPGRRRTMRIARAETGCPAWSYTHTLPRQPVLRGIAHARPARARRTRTSVPCSRADAGRTAVPARRSTIPRTAGGASETTATASRSTTESKHRELANACTTPSSGSSCAPTTHACGARSGQHATVPGVTARRRNRRRQPACHVAAMQRARPVQPCGCAGPRGTGQ